MEILEEKQQQKFSVLMSIYKKEQPQYLKECLMSLINQTLRPTEIVLVEDGPLTDQLYEIVDQFEKENSELLQRIPLKENVGLGRALAIGVEACQHPLIARMDTDDIAESSRFEKQISEFENNPKLGLLGSDIDEFENTISDVITKRIVPHSHEEIVKHGKRRNPFNHMTVMYKKIEVIDAGNYQPLNGFEDYYLWIRMLKNGTIAKNLPEVLVFARAGREMFKRRGGYKYLKDSIHARRTIYKVGFNSYADYFISVAGQIFVSIVPNKMRAFIYTKFLRN